MNLSVSRFLRVQSDLFTTTPLVPSTSATVSRDTSIDVKQCTAKIDPVPS